MNSIDLLDKLNLPAKLGLEGEDALFSKKTIMDAYLSAASLQFNRQFFSNESIYNNGINDGGFSLNQMCMDLPKAPSVDLFKMLGSDSVTTDNSEEGTDTKIVLDLMKMNDMNSYCNHMMPEVVQDKSQEVSQSQDQIDTESESYTKLETEHKKHSAKKGKAKRGDKSDINSIIQEERRRLCKKLDSCSEDRVVFKRRVKNAKKNQANAENYRGSKYWGVSKNKSKWQVSVYLFECS